MSQSWFRNSFRGNTPYFDFEDFHEVVRHRCDKLEEKGFEPSAKCGARTCEWWGGSLPNPVEYLPPTSMSSAARVACALRQGAFGG